MNFQDAMGYLNDGHKVTRIYWPGLYFIKDAEGIKTYQPVLKVYSYDESIMTSSGWLIDNDQTEYNFCDIIPFLQKGSQARLKDWKESFIYLDRAEKVLVLRSMENFQFNPDFNAFIATDWEVLG